MKDDIVGNLIRAEFSAAIEPADDRRVKFICSTGGVNRNRIELNPGGWLLDSYRKNPVVLANHDSTTLPIGRAVAVAVEGGRLLATIEFAGPEISELGDRVYRLVQSGFLRAVSVGCIALEARYDASADVVRVKRQELIELSVVAVGADSAALVAAALRRESLTPPAVMTRRAAGDSITAEAWSEFRAGRAPDIRTAIHAAYKRDAERKAAYHTGG